MLNDLDTEMKEPRYWRDILQNLELHGINVAKLKTIRSDYPAYTAEQVREVFRRYYTPSRTVRVLAAPATQPASRPAAVGASPG